MLLKKGLDILEDIGLLVQIRHKLYAPINVRIARAKHCTFL